MVEHQAVGVNRAPEALDQLFQRLQEPLPVRLPRMIGWRSLPRALTW